VKIYTTQGAWAEPNVVCLRPGRRVDVVEKFLNIMDGNCARLGCDDLG